MSLPLASPPYGRDVSCTDRLYPGRLVSGARLLAEAAYRRLTTPRGMLEDDPSYGYTISGLCSRAITPDVLASEPAKIRNEIEKDSRVAQGSVVVTMTNPAPNTVTISVYGEGADGTTFDLAIRVSDVRVELLHLGGS